MMRIELDLSLESKNKIKQKTKKPTTIKVICKKEMERTKISCISFHLICF